MKDRIFDFIIKIIQEELNINLTKPINKENTLMELGIDSISFMALIVYIENQFTIELLDIEEFSNDYENLSLARFIDLVDKKIT